MAKQSSFRTLNILVIFTTIFGTPLCLAHREHKVHNIVLYPDKHSWCQTQQIKQVISYPGCKSEEIDNNVCVGACFSYSIPHTEPSDPGELIVPYCDSCQPSDTTWHHVTLQCEKNDKTPPQLVKRVQIINNCSCTSCDVGDRHRYKIDSSDDDDDFLIAQQNDVPDFLRLLNNHNESFPSSSATAQAAAAPHTDNLKALLNHKIVTLLKNIHEKNSRYDKDQLTELLKAIQSPERHGINDDIIAHFVDNLNSDNVELDKLRLDDVLSKFTHSKGFEKHKKYMSLGGVMHPHHAQLHHTLNGAAGTTVNNDIEDDQRRHNRHHHHSQHHANGQHPPSASHSETSFRADNTTVVQHDLEDESKSSKDDDVKTLINSDDSPPLINVHHHRMSGESHHHIHMGGHQHSQHHRVGEEVVGHHGHLIKGPKGALVIEPDELHEKINVNEHELKPNHAGTLMVYSAGKVSSSTSSVSGIGDSDEPAAVATLVDKSSSSQDENDE